MQICDMEMFRSLKSNLFQNWFKERRGNSPVVFISHSNDDREQAALVVSLLRAAFCLPSSAIRCTSLEGYRLACGAGTDETLKKEVLDCEVLIAMVSESSMRSAYVLFELGARWGSAMPLFPLLISRRGAASLKGPLSGYNGLSAGMPGQLNQLITEVGFILGLEPEPPAVYQEIIIEIARQC
jgi:hypothetical protein